MGYIPSTWEGALRSFLLHLKATNRAAKTVRYYQVQLLQLIKWANGEDLALERFSKRHLDAYLSCRVDGGAARTTLRHDALTAKVFLKWCARNDYLEKNPLADYQVTKAPVPEKYMPSQEDMARLLSAIHDYWDRETNPKVTEIPPSRRSFHRDRTYAVILTLLDSACRMGEVLSLHVDDYRAFRQGGETLRQISVREAKGREARCIPISEGTAEAIEEWLKIRRRVMEKVPPERDEGWLFMSESNTRVEDRNFLRAFTHIVRFAGLSSRITLHSLRRFSLNKLAKHNLLAAQAIAGHKNPQTTLIYTKIDSEFVRQMHDQVGVVRGVLSSKRAEKKQRLVG